MIKHATDQELWRSRSTIKFRSTRSKADQRDQKPINTIKSRSKRSKADQRDQNPINTIKIQSIILVNAINAINIRSTRSILTINTIRKRSADHQIIKRINNRSPDHNFWRFYDQCDHRKQRPINTINDRKLFLFDAKYRLWDVHSMYRSSINRLPKYPLR